MLDSWGCRYRELLSGSIDLPVFTIVFDVRSKKCSNTLNGSSWGQHCLCLSVLLCLKPNLGLSLSLQHQRLHAIRQQRDKMIKEGTYTPPPSHTGQADQSPWGSMQLSSFRFLCIVNKISLFPVHPYKFSNKCYRLSTSQVVCFFLSGVQTCCVGWVPFMSLTFIFVWSLTMLLSFLIFCAVK